MIKEIIINTVLFFISGVLLLNLIVFLVYKTGIVHSARNRNGTLKKKFSLKGLMSMVIMLVLIIVFLTAFDYVSFSKFQKTSFYEILIANFILMLLLVFYDSFFIDLFVLGKWKPRFLKIPEEVTGESMMYHIKKQFTVGWLPVIIVVICGSIIYYWLFK
ncbi:MAG: hypothetical protein JXB17_01910 [Bacteroidales bacterium]|nr:hypothetical protein [Bacteroidales bacterium]